MRIVVDCSVAACWAIPDEISGLADAALQRTGESGALVPPIFWFELRNTLIVNERRGRLTEDETAAGLAQVEQLSVRVDQDYAGDRLMILARQHRLSIYDAAYVELALRANLPLATLDQAMSLAAAAEGVSRL